MNDCWDVLIFKIEDRKVDTIAGERMRKHDGFHNANKRLETVLGRLNEHYNACIVHHGEYKVGDVLPEGV